MRLTKRELIKYVNAFDYLQRSINISLGCLGIEDEDIETSLDTLRELFTKLKGELDV